MKYVYLAVIAAVLGGVGMIMFGGNGDTDTTANVGDLNPISAAEAQDIDTSGVLEMQLGNPEAEVTVIEYASFTCPHCATFHQNTFKELKTDYIDTGKINFIYREVYFDRFGLWAGMVARCGGPERYFGITDLIYFGQREWTAGGDPASVSEGLRRIGRLAGLSDDQLSACLQDGDMANAMVALYQENAARDQINSTPSFLINGEKFSNMSLADFRSELDDKLGE